MNVETAFAPFLEPATMCRLLASHLPVGPGGPAQVRDVQVLHAWRKTWARVDPAHRAYLLVSYSVGIESPGEGGAERLLLQGRADLAGEPVEPAVVVPARGAVRGQGASPAWPLRLDTAHASLELRRFPDDAALPQLPALHARRAAPRIDAPPLRARVVSYRPGERCTLAFDDATGRAHAFAKTFADAQVARAVAARLEAVGLALQSRGASRLRVPVLLALEEPGATVWTGAIDGVALPAPAGLGLAAGGDAAGRPEELALALADLHGSVVPGLAPATREQRLREATRKLRKLAQALPAVAALATTGLARCESLLREAGLAALPLDVPRHGDVHPGQFRVCGRQIALFDFDELALGDAEEDLAALAVALEVAALESTGATGYAQAAQLLPRLAAAHAAGHRTRRALDPSLLEFHLRLQWLDRAYRSFWRDGARRRDLVELALGRVAAPLLPASPASVRT